VTGRYGTLGEVYYVDEDYWPLNTALYVIDFKGNHPRFVGYFLKHALATYQSDKAAVPGVNRNVLHALDVRCPPPHAQVRIAAILSAYDNLIDNNRRRMALLEHAACQLYHEWFVRLRFPGAEHTRMVDGVPKGWVCTTLGDCAVLSSGGTPSKAREDFWEGDIPWVSSGELTALRINDASLHVTEEGVEAGSRLVPANTILAVVRGMSLAKEFRLAMTTRTVCFNQDLKAIVATEDVEPNFLFHCLVA
jgi:type I restriction enzyme S subunit